LDIDEKIVNLPLCVRTARFADRIPQIYGLMNISHEAPAFKGKRPPQPRARRRAKPLWQIAFDKVPPPVLFPGFNSLIEEVIMENEKVMNRWLVVIGALLIQLCLGAIYAWSVSRRSSRTRPADSHISATQTQIIFSVGLGMFALLMPFAGKSRRRSARGRWRSMGAFSSGSASVLAGLFRAYVRLAARVHRYHRRRRASGSPMYARSR